MVQNAFIIMNIFIPSISILCNKNDFSKAGSKLSVRLLATNLALLKKYYQLAIVHIANANSILRNWKNKINLLIKIIYFFSVKWKLTACWDEKHWEKKVTWRNSWKIHYLRSKWVHFSAKKVSSEFDFWDEISILYIVAGFGKVESIWSIGKNHSTQYECETHVEELGEKN